MLIPSLKDPIKRRFTGSFISRNYVTLVIGHQPKALCLYKVTFKRLIEFRDRVTEVELLKKRFDFHPWSVLDPSGIFRSA